MRHALALSCVMAAASASAAERIGVVPGEAFTFKFSVGPIESGRARMSIGEPIERDGQRLLAVHGQAQTAKWLQLVVKLDDDYKLVLDAHTLLPVQVESVEHGLRERRIASTLHGRSANVEVSDPKTAQRSGGTRRTLPEAVRDPLTALFALRALRLGDGERLVFDVLDGAALWRVRARVRRGERVRIDADGEDARSRRDIRVDGDLERIFDDGRAQPGVTARHVRLWLSDDERRVLLKLEGDTDFGVCSLERPAPWHRHCSVTRCGHPRR